MWVWAAVTGIAVAVLLGAEWRGLHPLRAVAKTAASTGFLGVAVAAGALESQYGSVVLVALALSWLGDVLLLPRGSGTAFRAGLVSFLLGHVAFGVAFGVRGLAPGAVAIGALATTAVAVPVGHVLLRYVPDGMRTPVRAYVIVISAMVALAAGTHGLAPDARILAGALCFYVSDLAVARERFVANTFWNKAWGLPLYYGAQVLLAWSTAP